MVYDFHHLETTRKLIQKNLTAFNDCQVFFLKLEYMKHK